MPNKETKMSPEAIKECENVKKLFLQEKARSGMTHAILGKMIGKSPKLISAIVNNRTKVTIDVGRRLAKVFNVPLTEILPWTEEIGLDQGSVEHWAIIEDLQALSPENRVVAIRMIRNLLESQEES